MTTKTTPAATKIAARIKALLAKSVENGATEEEALAAMEKARELMDKYGVTASALEAEADTIKPETMRRDGWGTFIIKDRLASNVARYTDCKIWFDFGGDFHVLGSDTDRLFCMWLLDSLDQFIRRSCVEFIKTQTITGKKWDHEKAFCIGAINRINERLTALIAERRTSVQTKDGRSLVVIKSDLVTKAFDGLGLKLRRATSSVTYKKSSKAYAAGHAAGGKAKFSRPVNGGAGVKAIAG